MEDTQEPQAGSPELSVVLPVYNEVETLAELVTLVLALPIQLEILAVDDGSTDESPQILADIAAQEPRLRVFAS